MPYEGQPFQNTIFKKSKEINNSIRTVGYVHSFPVGLPSNLILMVMINMLVLQIIWIGIVVA